MLVGCGSSANFLENDTDWHAATKISATFVSKDTSLASVETLHTLDLSAVVRLTLAHNPKLQMQKRSVLQIGAEGIQADLYPNPSLEFFIGEIALGTGRGFRDSEIGVGVRQEIILGSGKFYQVQALSKKQKAALASFHATCHATVARSKKLFMSVLFFQESLKLAQSLKENASSLVEILQAKYQEGVSGEVELLAARTFQARREAVIANLNQQLVLSKKQLAANIGDLWLADKNYTGSFAPIFCQQDLERLQATVMQNPLLMEAQYGIEEQQDILAASEAERIPNVTAFLGYQRNEVDDANTLQMGLSIPLPVFNRNQGKIASARQALESAQAGLKDAKNNLLAELQSTYVSHKEAQKQIEIFKNHTIPLVNKTLDLARLEFEEGRQSFLLYLEANRSYHETRSEYLEAIGRAIDTQIELEKLQGIMLNTYISQP
jgi:cobalt-zinc-cadmium efflux system outer membrane protein